MVPMDDREFIYLDHAAATPLSEAVLTAMQPYFADMFYNPSSPYAPAIEARRALEVARHRLAVVIGGQRDDIILTAGATESINLAMTAARDGHVVTSAIEHDAVLASARQYDHTVVDVLPTGVVSEAAIIEAITDRTMLVSVALANNELGTIQPLRRIAEQLARIRERRLSEGNHTPLWLHSDASQGVGQIDTNVARLGVDLLTLNSGKIYGPKQVGLLWRRPGVQLHPIIWGGGQEMNLRSGTENVAGAVGFATALERADAARASESKRLAALRDATQQRLTVAFPDMLVTAKGQKRLAGHLHVSFPGLDAERLVFRLETRGVLVATGSACAANKNTRSHVLTALGLEAAVADGSLRLTFGKLTDEDNVARATDIICEEVAAEYARQGAR